MTFLIFIEEKGTIFQCQDSFCKYENCNRDLSRLPLKHFKGSEAVICDCNNAAKYPLQKLVSVELKSASKCLDFFHLGTDEIVCKACKKVQGQEASMLIRRQKKAITNDCASCEQPWKERNRIGRFQISRQVYQNTLRGIADSMLRPSIQNRRGRTRSKKTPVKAISTTMRVTKRKDFSLKKTPIDTLKRSCYKPTPEPMMTSLKKTQYEDTNNGGGIEEDVITSFERMLSPSQPPCKPPHYRHMHSSHPQQQQLTHLHPETTNNNGGIEEVITSFERMLSPSQPPRKTSHYRHMHSSHSQQQQLTNLHPDIIQKIVEENAAEHGWMKVPENTVHDSETIRKIVEENAAELGWKKVPNTHEVIHKTQISRTENEKAAMKLIKDRLMNGKKYQSHHPLERQLLGQAAIVSPKCSQEVMENIAVEVYAAFILKLGFDLKYTSISTDGKEETRIIRNGRENNKRMTISLNEIARGCPKYKTFGNLTRESAVQLLLLEREKMLQSKAVYFNSDKDMDGHLVKTTSHFDREKDKVVQFLLDMEKCSGYSDDTAKATKHSLERMCVPADFKIAGIATDGGGGGTGYSLMRELIAIGLCFLWALVALCALHGLNLVYQEALESIIGPGGLEERNALQFTHAIHDLFKAIGKDDWRSYANIASEELGIPIRNSKGDIVKEFEVWQEPVMTRWWTIGIGVALFVHNERLVLEIIIMVIEGRLSNKDDKSNMGKAVKIAYGAFNLFNEGIIRADMYLIHGFTSYFLFPHLDWFQQGDERIGGTPGFRARQMLSRYFLMDQDLHQIADEGWRKKEKFFRRFIDELSKDGGAEVEFEVDTKTGKKFMKMEGDGMTVRDIKPRSLTLTEKAREIHKANMIAEVARKKLHSIQHFQPYRDQDKLLFLNLFDEAPVARNVAKILLGEKVNEGFHFDQFHGRKIDLGKFSEFVLEKFDLEKSKVSLRINHHLHNIIEEKNIRHIALLSTNIWEGNSKREEEIVDVYKDNYAALPSTTHFVESSVKTASISDNGQRNAQRCTQYAIGSNIIRERNVACEQSMLAAKEASEKSYKDEKEMKVRGEHGMTSLLSVACNNYLQFQAIKQQDSDGTAKIMAKMHKSLKEDEESFARRLQRERLEKSAVQREKNRNKTVPKAALIVGTDIAARVAGRCKYCELRSEAHFDILKAEVEARGGNRIDPNSKSKWKVYLNELKRLTVKEDGEATGSKTFKPITCSLSDIEAIDASTIVAGRYKFSDLRSIPHNKILKAEVEAREGNQIDPSSKFKWKVYLNELKRLTVAEDGDFIGSKTFKPITCSLSEIDSKLEAYKNSRDKSK